MMIAQDTPRYSNLVKYEQFLEFRHCREVLPYTGSRTDFKLGDLVAADGSVPATAGDIAGLLLEAKTDGTTKVVNLIVLARGAAGVSDKAINYGTLAKADVKKALLAMNGIKVLETVV